MRKYQIRFLYETEPFYTEASVIIKAESAQAAYNNFCYKIFNKYKHCYVSIKNNVITVIKYNILILYYNFKIMEVE